jgi:hypothetical protein
MIGSLVGVVSELETGRGSRLDAELRYAVGYHVDAPEGRLGLVQGVPHAGRPPQPLVLVVSDGATVRFVPLRRVAAVLPSERRIVLRPREVPAVSVARAGRKAA